MGKSGIRAPPFSFTGGGFLMATIDDASVDRLTLIVNARVVPLFFQLLGHGFYVNVQTGCSVKELLCNQLGIHEDYLAQRIQTIFLNAKVVDDVKSAIKEIGPTFLERGIWIETEECKSFIERHSEELKAGCVSAELKDNSIETDHLQDITWKGNLVFLKIISNK